MRGAWRLAAAVAAFVACQKPTPAPHEQPLRVGLYVAPLSLDPHGRNEFVTFAVLSNVYEGLTALSSSLRVEPALAERWHNVDERTWRFRLRRGVLFHDGHPLTAADVVFSLQRARRRESSEFQSYLAAVESVREVAPDEVEIVTQRPNAVLLARLAFVMIVPKDSPDAIEKPIGTGPFRIADPSSRDPLRLAAFEGHWGGPPAVPAVVMTVVGGGDRAAALIEGRVDLLLDVKPRQIEAIRGAGLRVVTAPGPSVDVLQMRVDAPPFHDIRVRRAVSLALDREALVQGQLLGNGVPAGQLVSRNVFGFDPTIEPAGRDLPGARRLLADAGHPGGLDVDLEFQDSLVVEQVVQQLAEAGIRAQPRPRHWHDLIQSLVAGTVRFSYVAMVSDSGESGDLFVSTLHTKDLARGYGDANDSGYSNRALDAMVESSERTARLDERRRILQSCMRLVMQDMPHAPLFERSLIWGLRPGVSFEPRADGRVLLRDVRWERAGP